MENHFLLDECEDVMKAEPPPYDHYLCLNLEEEEEELEHPGQLCRLCANSTPDVIYIYGTVGEELSIASKINLSLPVMVKKTDPLPKQLCSSCVTKLSICHEFAESCLKAEEKLKALLAVKQFWSTSTVDEGKDGFPEEKLWCNNISADGKTEAAVYEECTLIQDSDPAEKTVCCPLCFDGKMKTCTEELNTEDELCDISLLCQTPKTENDTLSSNKINATEIVDIDAHPVTENVLCELTDDYANSIFVKNNEEWLNGDSAFENAEVLVSTLSSCEVGKDVVLNVEDVQPSILCQLCGEVFSSIEPCLKHSLSHAEDGFYPCSFCGDPLQDELQWICHIEEHKNDEKKPAKQSRGRLSCHICGRKFNNERTLNDHSCGASEVKHFRCAICKKPYVSEERLAFHNRFHEGARPNYCTLCGKEFDNEGSLYYHTRMVHEGARPFCCEQCGKRFYSKARLEAHQRVHSGERPFECELCGRRFYDRETLKGHYVTHMHVKPYQCDLCGACCGRKSMLKQHMHTHHSDQNVAKKVASLIHYYCKICNETFTNSTDVVNHRSTHWDTSTANNGDGKRILICEFCGMHFTAVAALGKHRKTKHPDERPYVCSICQGRSQTLYEARVHRRTHTSEENDETKGTRNILRAESGGGQENVKVFICEECGVSSIGRRKFAAHMKSHKAQLAYQCLTCGRHFSEKQRLLVHSRLHTGEKPYCCANCGKRFTQSSALYTHALLHTGEKPHKCDLCGKAFRIKADRDNHRRTHTGEKPYRCEYCQKQFRTGQVYYQHRMIHTGERRYPCDICGKAFKRSHTLAVHKRIHTGEKPNICDICGRGFRQRTDMKKHRALHTNTLFT